MDKFDSAELWVQGWVWKTRTKPEVVHGTQLKALQPKVRNWEGKILDKRETQERNLLRWGDPTGYWTREEKEKLLSASGDAHNGQMWSLENWSKTQEWAPKMADIFWQNVAVFISRFGVSQGRFTSFLKYFHFCEESIPGVSCSIAQWFVNVIIFMSVSYTEHVDSQHYCNNGWLWVCSYEERLIYFSFFQDGLFLFIVSKDIFRTTQKCSLSLSPPFSSPLHPLKLKVVLAMFDLAYLWAGFPQERKERLVQHTNTMGCQGLMEAGIQCGVQCVLYLCISRCFEPRVSHLYARHV